MKRIKIKISGIVQGVGFRNFVLWHARKLGLKGYVKNLSDGCVEAVFEGDKNLIEKMIEMCRRGPPSAKVDNLEIIEEKFKNEFESFKILY
jgi:acylphosphatase